MMLHNLSEVVLGSELVALFSLTLKKRASLMAQEVTRYIRHAIQCLLWGKAAGRCEFAGCNKPLWKSSVTQEQVNIAQKAHIYSFSDDGPRGNKEILSQHLNQLGNLMLICHECHVKIDKEKDG